MSNTSKFSCRVDTSDPSATLGLEIWLDNQQLLDSEHVKEVVDFVTEVPEDDNTHELRFILKNKTFDHTQVDKNGNILKDACLTVSNVAFEEIELGYVFTKEALYKHDFNGTKTEVVDKFHGTLGCNGTVSLKFTSPVYLWLLEHM